MSIDSVLLEADFLFMNIKEFVFYIIIGLERMWQNAISFYISRHSNLSFSKIAQLKFPSRSDLIVILFQMFIG